MILSQEEARTKWCPMARVAMPVNQTANRVATSLLKISDERDHAYFSEQVENCKCIASECMMWRWDAHEIRAGYCGLAGTPNL